MKKTLMIAHERRSRILDRAAKRLRVEVSELLKLTGASPATLRRDLDFLESRNLVVRVHGAVLHPSTAEGEPSLHLKSRTEVEAKKRIARVAAGMVADRASVFLDSGTTCLEVAKILACREGLTVITNSLAIAARHESFKARLVLTGGERRLLSGALVGRMASDALAGLRADIAFVGASGLDAATGPGTTELGEREVKAAWVAGARRAVLVCDGSKWESASTFVFARWAEFDDFVTDRRPPEIRSSKKPKIHIA